MNECACSRLQITRKRVPDIAAEGHNHKRPQAWGSKAQHAL